MTLEKVIAWAMICTESGILWSKLCARPKVKTFYVYIYVLEFTAENVVAALMLGCTLRAMYCIRYVTEHIVLHNVSELLYSPFEPC